MTNQQQVKWIKKYNQLNEDITIMLLKKERWKSKALKVTPTWSDMPKGCNEENPRELAMCEIMDCEREIIKLIDQLHVLKELVRKNMSEDETNPEILKIVKAEK